MNELLRTILNHVGDIFWIYLRFMVLAAVIFYIVQWYIRNYDEDDLASEVVQKLDPAKGEL